MFKHILSVEECAPGNAAEAIADIQVSGYFKLDPAEPTQHESEARFRLLSETSARLLATDTPQDMLNGLCREVMAHLECQAFFYFLVDVCAGGLRLNAYAGIPEEEARKIEWLDHRVAICGCVAPDGVSMAADDMSSCADPLTDLVRSFGIQAYACHPLKARGGLIGTLSFGAKTRTHFTPTDLALMKTVADQVAAALERRRLIAELQRSRDELELRLQERTTELRRAKEELRQEIEDRRIISALNSGRGLSFERDGLLEREGAEQATIHPTEDTVNGVPGAMDRISDMIESESIEKHLLQADRLSSLGAIAAGIAYEIRDPLTAMNLFLDLLSDKKKFRPTAHALNIMEEMKRNIRKIDRIIKRVTAFSGQGGATAQREVEMGALVEDTVSLWRSRMMGSSVQLRLSLDAHLANILGDPVEIQQVVTNLIQNAVEATEKGVVSITAQNGVFSLQENRPAVIIKVQDCGRGIARKHHACVFNPFFTTKSTGTGLGLAMSQRIVARHGGIIAFENVPDVGTTFWVMLPAARRAGMP